MDSLAIKPHPLRRITWVALGLACSYPFSLGADIECLLDYNSFSSPQTFRASVHIPRRRSCLEEGKGINISWRVDRALCHDGAFARAEATDVWRRLANPYEEIRII